MVATPFPELEFIFLPPKIWHGLSGAARGRSAWLFIRRSNSNIVGESRLAAQLPKGGDIGLAGQPGLN
ncbi:hypothetical protein CFAM422_007949 [Trichoderma lentiforme]|uniref:Uncharacterized protein n=1 Tax=Trichoderma lentiforme TaxID=1567552 RepID=A0A9P5C9Z5_9HYPO|nr:hypothetical protein CFAM422_007949 [Trichoderma lentiforme]